MTVHFKSVADLERRLIKEKIDLGKWGTAPAKTAGKLFEEYEDGESIFTVRDRRLLRTAHRVQPRIFVNFQNKLLYLREGPQRFTNGATRTRSSQRSLSEKIRAGESPRDALLRGVREELGIMSLEEHEYAPYGKPRKSKIEQTSTYPGLLRQHIDHRFFVLLPIESFKPFYLEEKLDRITEFYWEDPYTHERAAFD